jgi:hypothetical protein
MMMVQMLLNMSMLMATVRGCWAEPQTWPGRHATELTQTLEPPAVGESSSQCHPHLYITKVKSTGLTQKSQVDPAV